MPFRSKRQHRWMRAAEARGEIPKGTASRWAHHTPSMKKLPEKKSAAMQRILDLTKEAASASARDVLGVATGFPMSFPVNDDKVKRLQAVMEGLRRSGGLPAYEGYLGVSAQGYSPIQKKRELTPEEQAAVAAGKRRWLPKIFSSYATPLPELMASPLKNSLLAGGVGGLAGAVAGGLLGSRIGQPRGSFNTEGGAIGAGIGGLSLGTLAALLNYFSTKADNESIEELMRRLPEGSTMRDMLSDPAWQADMMRRTVASSGGRPIVVPVGG